MYQERKLFSCLPWAIYWNKSTHKGLEEKLLGHRHPSHFHSTASPANGRLPWTGKLWRPAKLLSHLLSHPCSRSTCCWPSSCLSETHDITITHTTLQSHTITHTITLNSRPSLLPLPLMTALDPVNLSH